MQNYHYYSIFLRLNSNELKPKSNFEKSMIDWLDDAWLEEKYIRKLRMKNNNKIKHY